MPSKATTSTRSDVRPRVRVIATAGHVDHGKSSLIVRLTGIDPDRWAEEKRRGLTIDLGYAWCQLPSGREVGFVDVPGHERFVRNMLAGVGPVRLVLFVVAADEGWRQQSEEHLQILDVLGIDGGVVALSKRDLVDEETLAIAEDEVRERLEGTVLEAARVVPVSAHSGEGLDELTLALDALLAAASPPEHARARLFVDRVFTIRGAGTVATGTLTGDCLEVGDEVQLYPTDRTARIRSLQTHKHREDRACPVTRVAANLVGVEREDLERGDVLGLPGAWRPTTLFDATLREVRGLSSPISERGAFKIYAGSEEVDARIRIAETPAGASVVRVRTARPVVLDVGDRFVLREAGRRTTIGGGRVLDVWPPKAFTRHAHLEMLDARGSAPRQDLPRLAVDERGAIPAAEVESVTGASAEDALLTGAWCVSPSVRHAATDALVHLLQAFHRDRPLEEGMDLALTRPILMRAARAAGAPADPSLADALLDATIAQGTIVRTGTMLRLATHRVAIEERADDIARLLAILGGDRESTPPTIKELEAEGFPRALVEAAARAGTIVRIGPDLVIAPSLVDRAMAVVRTSAEQGITVSALREALGTSRKFAVPLVEWMDRERMTRRVGDLRFPGERA
jgi:selenocysteine-specific elongation factor